MNPITSLCKNRIVAAAIIFFLVSFFHSCRPHVVNSMEDVLKAIATEEQGITIDASKDNFVEGKKGTRIFFPANTFQFRDGTTPTGKITIRLKEFFSTADFLSANLSSVSDSFLLETGGMLFIDARNDGKELEINPSASYVIAFPKKDTTKEMGIFYGVADGQVGWQPDWSMTGGEGGAIDSLLVDSSLYKLKTRVCGRSVSHTSEPGWKLDRLDSIIYSYVENNFSLPSSLYREFCNSNRYWYDINLALNNTGKITDVTFDSTAKKFHAPIISFFKNMPPLDKKLLESLYMSYGYKISLCCHSEMDMKEYRRRFDKKYSQYRNKAIEAIDKNELNFYILSATRLGWINCDRFIYDTVANTDFIVNVPEMTNDGKLMLVFESINSIMQGESNNSQFRFQNIPLNSKVKIIGISYKDGKPLMGVKHTTVTKQAFILTGFNSFTTRDLEEELNKP